MRVPSAEYDAEVSHEGPSSTDDVDDRIRPNHDFNLRKYKSYIRNNELLELSGMNNLSYTVLKREELNSYHVDLIKVSI